MDDDSGMVVELLRIVRREMADGFESVREEQKRIREALQQHKMDHEDNAMRIASLEQGARRRVARK
jgi:hypothetical protein